MTPDAFRQALLEYKTLTREMVPSQGDPGAEPVTKISGVPWWPASLPRPTCEHGHLMAFMSQVLLSDVPALSGMRNTLMSFHYCETCMVEGKMSHGWDDSSGNRGYEVAILSETDKRVADGLGIVTESPVKPMSVMFREVVEVPMPDDLDIIWDCPDDYPQGADDFDENICPGVVNVAKPKVGGWPRWVQNCAWPPQADDERVGFVCQLDWMTCQEAAWCLGGYAYLLVKIRDGQPTGGELALQST